MKISLVLSSYLFIVVVVVGTAVVADVVTLVVEVARKDKW